MHLILLLVGAVLAAAGVAMVNRCGCRSRTWPGPRCSRPAWSRSSGALIIAALAVVARNLGRIAERLEIQPLPLPPVAAVGREDPAPRPVRAAASAQSERRGPRCSAGSDAQAARPAAGAPAAAQRRRPRPNPQPPPVDLAPLTRIPETAPPPPPVPPPAPPAPAPPLRPQPRSAPQRRTAPATTVYRSGVIDGMAYSLFMDGSIEAELPTGRVKFATDRRAAAISGEQEMTPLTRQARRPPHRSRRRKTAPLPSAGRSAPPRRRGLLPCWCAARSSSCRC